MCWLRANKMVLCWRTHNILKMFSFNLSCILMLLLIVLTKCKLKRDLFVKKYIKNNWYSKVILPLLSVIQKPKSNLEVDREQERCSQMQTVKDIPRLNTCTSPQFLHKLQTFQMNTAINTTLRVTWCGFWNWEGYNVLFMSNNLYSCWKLYLVCKKRTGVL